MIIPKFIIDQSIINDEIRVLNNILSQQRQLKQTLFLYLEKISEGIYNAADTQDSTSLISCLNSIQKSFENIKENINKILELKKYLEDTFSKDSYDSSYFEYYNNEYMKLFEKISEDNNFYYTFMESLLKYMNVAFPEISINNSEIEKIPKIEKTETLETSKIKQNIETNNTSHTESSEENAVISERTLFISEKNAILPYSTCELENYFSDNPEKYSSIQDIIDKEYTISLNEFNNGAFTRFKETYNLAKNKSKLSVLKSLSLANELFFNSNLDPIIIKACKNINELYIYLSCLEENDLKDFKCFKIIYDT